MLTVAEIFRKLTKNYNLNFIHYITKTSISRSYVSSKSKNEVFFKEKGPTNYLVVSFCNRNRYAEANYELIRTSFFNILFYSYYNYHNYIIILLKSHVFIQIIF